MSVVADVKIICYVLLNGQVSHLLLYFVILSGFVTKKVHQFSSYK